ncbi:C4b-binding protein alpha chain-like isoform X2 [Pelmatolapia mariae]|uniref:C4b-binding protein alpha chain-like isoform X2 n=1 Tax=Pelmatolapia mariae TaxID=158779 RepID=UPI002FE5797C
MGITAVLLLSSLVFLAITAQVQNCSRPPKGDNMDLKGNDILLTSFPDGTTVTFACNTGYESAGGSPRITCTAGSWSSLGLKCQRKNCGPAGEVENGQIDYRPGSEFGDRAVLICNPGHMPVGGGDLICGSQGWSGRLPVCEVTQCESPPVVEYGSVSPNKELYDYKDVIVYACKKDYTLNGSRQLHCSDDGTFKPEPPKCIKVECGEPEISFGQWSNGARPPYGYKSTVTLQCNTGYKMIGSATLTCELNSEWSPGLPRCIPNPMTTTTTTTTTITTTNPSTPKKPTEGCEDPQKRSAEVTVSSQPPYIHGVKVTLSCPSGYKLNGPGTQTCEKNGLWSPGIPECTLDNGNGSSTGLVIGILVGVGVVGGVVGLVLYKKNSKKEKRKHDSLDTPQLLAVKTAS